MNHSISPSTAAGLPYESLLAGSLQGVLLTRDGQVALANEAAANLFEAGTPAALEGLPLARLLGMEAAQTLSATPPQARAKAPQRHRVQACSLAGRPLALDVAACPLDWDGSEALQLTLLDRTELRAAQEAVAEREEAFRNIIDGSLQGIYVHVEHRFLFVNRTFAEMFGYDSPEEVLAMGDVLAVYMPQERERLNSYYQARVGGGEPPVRYEFQGQRKDGSSVWLENQVRVVTWQGQEAILATAVDISERKRAEQELLASEEKYRDAVEGALQGMLVQRQRKALFVNAAFARVFGYESPEQVLALDDLLELVHPEHRDAMVRYAQKRLRGESAPERYVSHGLRRDGEDIWLDVSVRVVNWEGAPALQVALVDVTERIRAQQALEAQQRLLQTVFDTIPHGLYVKGPDLRYQMANRAFCDVFQREAESIVGVRLDALRPGLEEMEERIHAADHAVMETGRPQDLYDLQVRRPDGTVRHLHLIKCPLRDAQGAVTGVVGITQDITQRMEAEERLRASERLMRLVIDRLPFRVFVKDRGGVYQLVNEAFAVFHGTLPKRIEGHHVTELPLGDVADMVTFSDTDRLVLDTGEPLDLPEVRLTPVGGPPTVNHMQKLPLRDDSGAIIGVVGLSEDITERIAAQEALRASQRLLHTVLDTIPLRIFVKTTDGRFQLVNRAYAEFYDSTPDAFVGMHHNDLPSKVLPHASIYGETDRQLLETGAPVEIPEITLLRPGKPPRIHSIIKMPLRDGEGRIVGIVGVSEDITERRRVLSELRAGQRLLRTVIDTIPLGIYVKDREQRYQAANEATAVYFGRSVDDIVGHTLRDLSARWTPALEAMERADAEVLETGEAVDLGDLPAPQHDGQERVWHVTKIPLLDELGHVGGVVGMAEDITERQRVEQELRTSRMLLQTVFDVLPLWVFVKDAQRRFLMVNRCMAEDHDLSEPLEPGTRMALNPDIPDQERSMIEELDQRVLDCGEPVETPELRVTLPSKGQRLFRVVRMPLRDDRGLVTGVVGAAEDITERRRTEQAIQQAQKLESLGVLAGGIAHDFNNLLVSILGNASLVLTELPADTSIHGPLANIETAGQRAAELCRQMLAYSGKGSFEIASINLNALIQEMTQLLQVSLARTITLTYEFDADLPAVEVDPTQIRQVVMNLVMNAAEAIGDEPGRIQVTTSTVHADRNLLDGYIQGERLAEGRYVCLEVNDTGQGISPETLGRIFDPFFTTKFTGRGLGLAAVLGIVRGHHGALQVTSTPGTGSAFRLLLPAQAAPVQVAAPAPAASRWRGQGTVLVVDDEREVRAVLERMLALLGFTVLMATDGPEAVARLEAHGQAIRMVVLDQTMPQMSGDETLYRLRELQAELPVVIISGYATDDVRERFGSLGVQAVLQKPFTLQALSEVMQDLLG